MRWLYFGDIFPNTAHAQNIHLTDRLRAVLALDTRYVSETLSLCIDIIKAHGWWLALFYLPLPIFAERTKENIFILMAIPAVSFVLALSPFLFGPARIDVTRTTTQLTLFLVFTVVYFALKTSRKRLAMGACAVSVALSVMAYKGSDLHPYYLGWSTDGSNKVRTSFEKIAHDNEIHLNPCAFLPNHLKLMR